MKKLHLCNILVVLIFFSAAHIFAQDYDLQFRVDRDDDVAAGFYDVTIQLAASSANFKMGSANLVFDFNTAALSAPSTIGPGPDSLQIQTIHNFSNGGKYQKIRLTSPASGRLSMNIELNTPGSGDTLLQAYTDVATVRFTIVNASETADLVWRTSSPNATIVFDDTESSMVASDELNGPATLANLRIFLEGPYVSSADSMNTTLLQNSVIPLSHPYGGTPWNYAGTDTVKAIPDSIVDWLLVELRSNQTTVAAQRTAFLKRDGSIVDLNGTSPVTFNVADGFYYVVIYHRNHLAIMTADSITLADTVSAAGQYNFTDAQTKAFGASPMKVAADGKFALKAGDADGDGQIQNDDKNTNWTSQVGQSGYRDGDFNMNNQVQNDDKNTYWTGNVGSGTQVPDEVAKMAPGGKGSKGGGNVVVAGSGNNSVDNARAVKNDKSNKSKVKSGRKLRDFPKKKEKIED